MPRIPSGVDQAEIYVSIDGEMNGPVPGPFSLLSIGLRAFSPFQPDDRFEIASYEANLDEIPGAGRCPETMAWWAKNQAAYDRTRENTRDPAVVMPEIAAWARGLPGTPVLVGYPILFDGMFLLWYLHVFAKECPFRFDGIDVGSYAMALMHRGYRDCRVKNMPRHWLEGRRPDLSHSAAEDAQDQGRTFINMFHDAEGMSPPLWPPPARRG